MANIIKNILLVFFSLLIAFCLGEIIIRFVNDWYSLTLDKRGSWLVFSKRGYTLNKNSGSSLHQFVNRAVYYHFYPPHLRDTPINQNAFPILVLGDSFTFGWLLPWEKTYVYHLQANADQIFGKGKYQFLNAATAAWGTANYLAYLEEYGTKLSPKYVLIYLNTDDIGRSIKRDIYRLKDANSSLQLVENFRSFLPFVLFKNLLSTSFINWLFEHSILVQFVRANFSHFFTIDKGTVMADEFASRYENPLKTKIIIPSSPDLSFQDEFAIRLGEAFFLRINQWCNEHHAKLLVVTTGFNAFYPDNMRDPTKTFLTQAKDFFAKENIPYYDIASSYKQSVKRKNFQIPYDEHPNEFGAQVIAELSWPWIKKQIEQN